MILRGAGSGQDGFTGTVCIGSTPVSLCLLIKELSPMRSAGMPAAKLDWPDTHFLDRSFPVYRRPDLNFSVKTFTAINELFTA